MKNIIKKMALASAALSLGAVILLWVPQMIGAAYNQYQATKYNDVTELNVLIRDVGIYDNNSTPRARYVIDQSTAMSSANTSGFSGGRIEYALLGAGTATPAIEGSVLCVTSPQGGLITLQVCPTTLSTTSVVGLAAAAASTGTLVGFYADGFAQALTTGTVNAGDLVYQSSLAAGYLSSAQAALSTTTINGIVGIACANGTAAGGRTRIKLRL